MNYISVYFSAINNKNVQSKKSKKNPGHLLNLMEYGTTVKTGTWSYHILDPQPYHLFSFKK